MLQFCLKIGFLILTEKLGPAPVPKFPEKSDPEPKKIGNVVSTVLLLHIFTYGRLVSGTRFFSDFCYTGTCKPCYPLAMSPISSIVKKSNIYDI